MKAHIPVMRHTFDNAEPERARRAVARALFRGFRQRCPHCGEGRLFGRYLKPVPECPVCGEDLSHQRADDAPPYFTMVLVGHLIVPIMVTVTLTTNLPSWMHLAVWLPLTAILTLALLQPVKGAVIGVQWALYMHGFDGSSDPDAMPEGHLLPDRQA